MSETTGLSNQRPAHPVKKNDAVSDARRERVPAPMETDGAAHTTSKTSRKQQREETRSATRLLEYQKKVLAKQREARWLLLTQPLQRKARWLAAQESWKGWMRAEVVRREVRKKLRRLLWRAWWLIKKRNVYVDHHHVGNRPQHHRREPRWPPGNY